MEFPQPAVDAIVLGYYSSSLDEYLSSSTTTISEDVKEGIVENYEEFSATRIKDFQTFLKSVTLNFQRHEPTTVKSLGCASRGCDQPPCERDTLSKRNYCLKHLPGTIRHHASTMTVASHPELKCTSSGCEFSALYLDQKNMKLRRCFLHKSPDMIHLHRIRSVPYKCMIKECGKSFGNRQEYIQHIGIHAVKKQGVALVGKV